MSRDIPSGATAPDRVAEFPLPHAAELVLPTVQTGTTAPHSDSSDTPTVIASLAPAVAVITLIAAVPSGPAPRRR